MNTRLNLLAGISGLLFASALNSGTFWFNCHSCDENLAKVMATGVGPDQTVVLFSMAKPNAYKYRTRLVGTDGKPCPVDKSSPGNNAADSIPTNCAAPRILAEGLSMEASELAYVDALHDFHVLSNGTMKAEINVQSSALSIDQAPGLVAGHPSGPIAIDFINNANHKLQIEKAAMAHIRQAFHNGLWSPIAARRMGVQLGFNPRIVMNIEFPDLSAVQLEFRKSSETPYLLNSRGHENRSIITRENLYLFLGAHTFSSPVHARSWMHAARQFGAQVISPESNSVRWHCTDKHASGLLCRPESS